MRRRQTRNRRSKHNRAADEPVADPAGKAASGNAGGQRRGAHYMAGPALHLPSPAADRFNPAEETATPKRSGRGTPSQASAKGRSVTLEGRTDAEFDGGAFETRNTRATPAEGCGGCGDCVRVRGTLVARYHVATTVTLPSVHDYPDLTPCEQRRVQHAIDTVLAPHEQEHVDGFEQYNGVTRTPFDLTLCRGEFEAAIRRMFEAQEARRRAAAQAASDALDPFNFTVDLDCEDEDNNSGPGAGDAEPKTGESR